MMPDTPDNLDLWLSSRCNPGPTAGPWWTWQPTLAGGPRPRGIAGAVVALCACSVAGILSIVAILFIGYGLSAAVSVGQAVDSEQAQGTLAESTSLSSLLSLQSVGLGLMALVLVGLTIAAAFTSPADGLGYGVRSAEPVR